MPNKIAPSLEEAKKLFEQNPNRLLKDWAKEWNVSVERVRQIKEECGFTSFKNVNYELVETIVNRILHDGYTVTNREMYKDLPIGYDRFRTWCLTNPDVQELVDSAREQYLSSDKTEKKCYKCQEILPLNKFNKSQKYKDGYNRYCITCVENAPEEVKRKTCMMCQKDLSTSSFNANRKMPDGFAAFCKTCQSNQRRKKRRLNSKLGI